MAELVDALGSGSSLPWEVLVQVQFRAHILFKIEYLLLKIEDLSTLLHYSIPPIHPFSLSLVHQIIHSSYSFKLEPLLLKLVTFQPTIIPT